MRRNKNEVMEKFKKISQSLSDSEVLQLWREERLYVLADKRPTTAELRREALDYVRPLAALAAPEWQERHDELWTLLLQDRLVSQNLAMARTGCLNRYYLTAIMVRLKEQHHVYLCTAVRLHLAAEGVQSKNSVYKGAANYPLSRTEATALAAIVARVSGGCKKSKTARI